jgi:transposase
MLDILGESQKADKNQENYIFYRQRLKSILDNLPTTLDKQSKRLAKSLIKNQDHIFNFLLNPEIPHHNNDTERELRKSKIKSKIAGCFRTLNGFEIYASILTFIQTCRKQGQNIYTQLQKIFNLESPDLVWE